MYTNKKHKHERRQHYNERERLKKQLERTRIKQQIKTAKVINKDDSAAKQLQQLGLNDDQIKQALQSGSINLDDGSLKKVKRI